MRKRRIVIIVVALLLLVLLVAAGYLSTALSLPRCYQAVARVASRDLTKDRFFYLQIKTDEATAQAAFDSVGAQYSLTPVDAPRFPRLYVATDRTIPFIISISYLYERDFEVGEGAERSYICIFGWIIDRGQTVDIVS